MNTVYIIAGVALIAFAGWIITQLIFTGKVRDLVSKLSAANASLSSADHNLAEKNMTIGKLEMKIADLEKKVSDGIQMAAYANASRDALNEKLSDQKKDLEEMGKKLNDEFEVIANRILETKTEKFTELNKKNLGDILEPLGKNIEEFKKTVQETYVTEAKERFSLGEKVRELALLNQQIGEEARNLTRALKGQSKTQGRWGEMILESILE